MINLLSHNFLPKKKKFKIENRRVVKAATALADNKGPLVFIAARLYSAQAYLLSVDTTTSIILYFHSFYLFLSLSQSLGVRTLYFFEKWCGAIWLMERRDNFFVSHFIDDCL